MEEFGEPIYTSPLGVEFRIRESTGSVYTYHPRTEEWVNLCTLERWPDVAKRFGLRVIKKGKKEELAAVEQDPNES